MFIPLKIMYWSIEGKDKSSRTHRVRMFAISEITGKTTERLFFKFITNRIIEGADIKSSIAAGIICSLN